MSAAARGSYPFAVAIALLGLGPNVVLSTAFVPLETPIATSLGAGSTGISLGIGLSSAAYAVGAVLAAQLGERIVQRRIFLTAEAVFLAASVLTAAAPDLAAFLVGHVAQGLAAGAMLITSLPPLVTRFGARRVPLSAAIVNVGIFGASTLGPLVGGLAATGSGWRWLMAAAAVLAAVGWLVAHVGYDEWEPSDPEFPIDTPALALVVVSTVATFAGASLVEGRSLGSWEVLLPLVGGLVCLVALLLVESRKEESLIPVGALATQLPVTGMLVAMIGGAVFVAVVELVQTRLAEVEGRSALDVAGACWPTPVGAAVAALVFWRLFPTRWVPVLIDTGLLALAAAPLLLLLGSVAGVLVPALLLLGFGAGATVSPGLFITGFGLASTELARAFALVQLLRSVATYAVAPVVLALATAAASMRHGIAVGLAAMAAVAGAGLVAALLVPALSGARLREPDLEAWLEGQPGLPSPTTGTHVRPAVEDPDAAPLLPRRLRRDRQRTR